MRTPLSPSLEPQALPGSGPIAKGLPASEAAIVSAPAMRRAGSSAAARLNFALIGCGRVSENHLTALTSSSVPGRLVAVADADTQRAQQKGVKFDVPFYTDFERMLGEHPEIDVLDLATPTGYHATHVKTLARFGKHIVVEKPMALTVEDCEQMIATCQQHGVRLFVVKQNRFNPAVVATREAFEAGRFGKLVLVTVRVRWRRDQSYYDADHWHGRWALDGGVMSQQASHHIDLMQWFLGPIESVQCQTANRLLRLEAEDTAAAILKAKDGALGILEATVAARPENLEGSLSILGEKGSVIVGGVAVNQILYWKFAETQPEDERIQHAVSQHVPTVYGNGHLPYLRNVAEAILKGSPGLVESTEGKRNVEILTALYESAAMNGAPMSPGCPIRHSRLGRG
jgi:UDP-N-acetyl-2-amino-2-deoxyglucuronate dehydrogenase